MREYDTRGPPLRRYVHGDSPGDDPLVWFEGAGVADSARRYLFAHERGSVVAVSDANGNALTINSYDEYGILDAGNSGRFGYIWQAWLPELGSIPLQGAHVSSPAYFGNRASL